MGNNNLGDNERLSILVNKYADMVLRLALANIGNLADAQDVCQEVFIKLFKNQPLFNDNEHEKAWIIRVTLNKCKDIIRSPWKKWFLPVENLPYKYIENSSILPVILNLPQKYRIVIHLYYYEGYKSAEISKLLNSKESTIRTQLKRAKVLLKKRIIGGLDDDN